MECAIRSLEQGYLNKVAKKLVDNYYSEHEEFRL